MLPSKFFSLHIDFIGLFRLGKTNEERIQNFEKTIGEHFLDNDCTVVIPSYSHSYTKKEKYNFPFEMLCDPPKDMLKSYKAWGLKKFMGKEYEGIHRISYLIKDGVIKYVFDKVKTKTHAVDVLNEAT